MDSTSADANQWRGNSIFDNETVTQEGQITLRGRVGFGVYNGHNRIADSTETHPLMSWVDQPTADWYRDVFWGSTDTNAVKSRLPATVVLSEIDSSWSSCAAFAEAPTSPDSLMRLFLTPQASELAGSFVNARTGYKSLVAGTPRSDFACAASDRLLTTALAAGDSMSVTRAFLDSVVRVTPDISLRSWLKNCIAWCLAEDGSFAEAGGIYDSLASNTPTQLDRVSARVQRLMLSVLVFRADTADYKAADLLSVVDSARTVLGTVNSWSQSVITDSVTMYAPCYVDTAIAIEAGGRLVIRPHPGAHGAIVHFAPDAAINSYGYQGRAKLYVLGEADNPVTLQWDSSANWANVQTLGGDVYMEHATLQGRGFLSYSDATYGYFDFQVDSCEFQDFGEGIWVWAADSGSYIKNSTLTGLGGSGNEYTGMGFGTGLTVLEGEQFTVENCTLENNEGVGLFGFFCAGLDVRNTIITGSDDYGILVWDGGELNLECTEVTQNGDTLPELWVENGVVDLVEGHNLFADSGGTLIYSANPSYIDVEDGQNRFELYGGSGTYIESGSPTSTWDVTYNNWSPLTPVDQASMII